jgi:hypothetical protein
MQRVPSLGGNCAEVSHSESSTEHHCVIASLLYCIILYTSSIGHRQLCGHGRERIKSEKRNARDVRQSERAQGPRARRRVRDSAEALDVDSPQAHCRFRSVLMTSFPLFIPSRGLVLRCSPEAPGTAVVGRRLIVNLPPSMVYGMSVGVDCPTRRALVAERNI